MVVMIGLRGLCYRQPQSKGFSNGLELACQPCYLPHDQSGCTE